MSINIHNFENIKVIEYINCNIYIIENLVSDEFCNELINFIYNKTIKNKKEIKNYNYVECYNILIDDLKKDKINMIDKEKINYYDNKIFEIVNNIIKIITQINPDILCHIDSGYELRKFFGRTELHFDGLSSDAGGYNNFIRSLTLIIALNDNFTGGVYNFPVQDFSIKMKKGQIICFPPFWTHPHQVSPVDSGEPRYTVNTWILEKFN